MDDPEVPLRELTLEEAVAVAIQLQKYGHLDEAQELYRRILEGAPEHPTALHFSGVLAHQQGRSDAAAALIERSLAVCPNEADWHSNLGIVYLSRGSTDRAVDAFRRAISLDPAHANARCNLGVALKAIGHPDEAEASYRAAIELDPAHVDAYTNLGILLNALERTEEAAACFCKVITLRPTHREARRRLAVAHCLLGEVEKAVKIFTDWLEEDPGDPIPRHMLAACTGQEVPARASNAFVEKTFDSFAASFEANLQQLSYRAPALIATVLEDSGLALAKHVDVLDAGCGTGLCGPLLAPYARTLTGVDLSARMLAHAEEKKVYDTLVHSEVTEYLRRNDDTFDVIVSADALVYFGDLDDVVLAAAGALRSSGLLVFTLEDAVGASESATYRLEHHGRYSHTRSYVEGLLARAGLQADILAADLRLEVGVPVAGLVVRARKRPLRRRAGNARAQRTRVIS